VRVRTLAAAFGAALAVAAPAVADPAVVGYPSSMASTGDSITRAFNLCFFPFVDCPANSWSTGTSSTVNSHYRRILAANSAISGRNFNDAESGADMADLSAQVQAAVAQGAQYVTILIGANDVCASSEAGMTPVATFRTQLEQAMATLTTGLPTARIYVVSIPRVYRLWEILRGNFGARLTWSLFGICRSMLANAGSNAEADVQRRLRVDQRNRDYNTQLASVCALYVHCRYDGNVVFNYPFQPSHVTSRDYFHPSVSGQTVLSAVTWAVGFDFTDNVPPTSTAVASGGTVTITAADNVEVRGVEYRLGAGPWTRYSQPVPLAPGQTITWRAVDVNGNTEATQTFTG
jgi:GDSL-like Lipase/Acylhydrolase family